MRKKLNELEDKMEKKQSEMCDKYDNNFKSIQEELKHNIDEVSYTGCLFET